MYYNSVLEIIGNTPLVKINNLNPNRNVTLLAKLEYLNPGGSVKDRIGLAMIEKAEKEGKLKPGSTIVEPTSGNTGVGLAIASVLRGYKTIFVMPDKQSDEKRNVLRAYGAKVVVTPTAVAPDDERSYYKVSDRLADEIPNAYKPNQYQNPENPKAHYKTTGPEIWEQTEGKITHFVCGMGTGGTISGIARYLKEKNPKIKVIGVDPIGSVFYKVKKRGSFSDEDVKPYKIEGVGEDFIPSTIDLSLVDEVYQISDKESFLASRDLAKNEALLTGGSAGMAFAAAQTLATKIKIGLIVVIFPDSGKSYLSKIYNDNWMRENGFLDHTAGIMIATVLKNKKGPKLISVKPNNTVGNTVKVMKKYDISQVLVIENNKIFGKVNESQLLTGLYDKTVGPSNKITAILDPNVSTVKEDESVDRVSELLSTDNLVVVLDRNGKPIGVITRIDLIAYYS